MFKVDKWIKKERAKYNRVMTSKSGQPNKEVPPAELATLQRWDFYKDHLLEAQNVVSCDVSIFTNFFWVCLSLYLSVISAMIYWYPVPQSFQVHYVVCDSMYCKYSSYE